MLDPLALPVAAGLARDVTGSALPDATVVPTQQGPRHQRLRWHTALALRWLADRIDQ